MVYKHSSTSFHGLSNPLSRYVFFQNPQKSIITSLLMLCVLAANILRTFNNRFILYLINLQETVFTFISIFSLLVFSIDKKIMVYFKRGVRKDKRGVESTTT